MKRMSVFRLIAGLPVLFGSPGSYAASAAYDNPSAYAYDDGWQSGDNGGYGFGAWTLTLTAPGVGSQNGHFMDDSALKNGNLLDDGTVGGMAGDNDVNSFRGPNPDISGPVPPQPVNLTVPRAWGMYANTGQTADAIRPFSGTLSIGQTVNANLDNGWLVNSPSAVGVGLQNAVGQNLWEVYFSGGGANYTNNDAAGAAATAIPYGDEGLNVSFTLTGPAAYVVNLTRFDGVSQVIPGNLMNPAGGQGIAQFRFFNINAGSGGNCNAFLGDRGEGFGLNPGLSIVGVPEPTALGLIGGFLLGLGVRRRWRGRRG